MTELAADGTAITEPIYLGAELVLARPEIDWTRHKGDGRPKILPPPGEAWRNPATNRKIGHRYYTRVTTFADAITEGYNLTAWKLRRALYGLSQRRDYVLAVAGLTLEDRDRDALDALVQLCLEAAGPNAAEMGTALHSLTERLDREEDIGNPPDEVRDDLAAYLAVTQGLITYRHREARVVCDELECAGTPDGHAVVHEAPPTDRGPACDCPPDVLRIIDTKTGSIRYPGKMSTQLAIYSRSHLYNPETGERIPVTVCPHWGVIVHLPVETGEAALFWLDLEHGWTGAELCGPVRRWHRVKADDILTPFAEAKPVKVVGGEVTRIEPRLASWNPKAPTERPADPSDITEALKVTAERVVAEPQAITAGHGGGDLMDALKRSVERTPAESEDAADLDGTDRLGKLLAELAADGHVNVLGGCSRDGQRWPCDEARGRGLTEDEHENVVLDGADVTAHEVRGRDEEGDEAALHEDLDGTDEVCERFTAYADGARCRTWESSDPAARQCTLPAGHPGACEYRDEPTPAEVRLDPTIVDGPVEVFSATLAVGEQAGPGTSVEEVDPRSFSESYADEELASGPDSDAEDDEPADGAPPGQDAGGVTDPAGVDYAAVQEAAEQPDPVLDAILACTHVRELEQLGTREWRSWTLHHKAVAAARHDELAAAEAARKPVAAFEAALATVATREGLNAIMAAVTSEPWLTDEMIDAATARYRELS